MSETKEPMTVNEALKLFAEGAVKQILMLPDEEFWPLINQLNDHTLKQCEVASLN